MSRIPLASAAVLSMLMSCSALADWSCQIDDVCMAGDMCRQPPEPIGAQVREGTEAWLLAPEGMASKVLNALSERNTLPFIAVSADAQGFEASAPSVTSMVVAEDGTLTISEIDLAPGVAVPIVYRGSCTSFEPGD